MLHARTCVCIVVTRFRVIPLQHLEGALKTTQPARILGGSFVSVLWESSWLASSESGQSRRPGAVLNEAGVFQMHGCLPLIVREGGSPVAREEWLFGPDKREVCIK